MFAYICGNIVATEANAIIIENNSIGYHIYTSSIAISKFKALGNPVQVYTKLIVNDDGLSLYGFCSMEEHELFIKLISISGVGAKSALQILSGGKVSDIRMSILASDSSFFTSIKGIGKKTAERIILELKDKVVVGEFQNYTNSNITIGEEAIVALVKLGFNRTECARIINSLSNEVFTIEELISIALKKMGR